MAYGRKTGGRAAGVPNKKTQVVADMLAELDCCPIRGMATLAQDVNVPVVIRAAMFRELAQYLHPKRRSVEIAPAEHFEPPQIVVHWVDADTGASDAADLVHVRPGASRN